MYNYFHPLSKAKETEKSSDIFRVTQLVSGAGLGFEPRQSEVSGHALNYSSAPSLLLWNVGGRGFCPAECHIAELPCTWPAAGPATSFFQDLCLAKL